MILFTSFHLSETKPSIPRTTLHRLPNQNLNRTTSSAMNLVVHHMLQPLIISWTQENLRVHLASSMSIVHDFIASRLVIVFTQMYRNVLDVAHIIERRCVTNFSLI